jgi:hypothetical protein
VSAPSPAAGSLLRLDQLVLLRTTRLAIAEKSTITIRNLRCLPATTCRACVAPCCDNIRSALPLFWETLTVWNWGSWCGRERQLTSLQLERATEKSDKCVKRNAHGAKVSDVTTLGIVNFVSSGCITRGKTKNGCQSHASSVFSVNCCIAGACLGTSSYLLTYLLSVSHWLRFI